MPICRPVLAAAALLLASILLLTPVPLLAQQPAYGPGGPPPLASLPQQVATLSDQPASHTSFTFDRSMLQSAQGILGGDAGAGRVIAGLSAITVDTYRFAQPAFYNPQAMSALVATFDANGWKHLVNAHATPGQTAQPDHPMTDLWLHFSGTDIDDVAVLSRGPRMMNLIEVTGNLRPLDLLHLSGHFGIPKVDPGAVMVPAPAGH